MNKGDMKMRAALILVIFSWLTGCGVGSVIIKSETISYDDVIEDTTNKLLLANILRARDKAPLHYSEITKISETVNQTASLSASVGFGWLRSNLTGRDTAAPGYTVQMSPNFELAHVFTKEFFTGIASPIDPKFVKYWLDRGLDQRVVLFLFFSSAEVVATEDGAKKVIKVLNAPRPSIDEIAARTSRDSSCSQKSEFERYITLVNNLKTFFANEYKEPAQLVAKDLTIDPRQLDKSLKAISALDPSKFKLKCNDVNCKSYNVETVSKDSEIALCYFTGHELSAARMATQQITTTSIDVRCGGRPPKPTDEKKETKPELQEMTVVFDENAAQYCRIFDQFARRQAMGAGNAPPLELRLNIRSVGEMIQFVGDLLELQDRIGANAGLNNPVTLGFCPLFPKDKACDDILFTVASREPDVRFTLPYRGKHYSIASFASPSRPSVKDHSLEVLAVIKQLVGLNRSASDVKPTPSVRLIP